MGESGLLFRIGADIKDFNKAMGQVQRSLKKNFGEDAMALSQGLVTAFAGLGAGLLAVGGASVKMAADMEQSKIAFTTLLGDAQKAEAFLQELSDMAASTPFELPGLIDASKKLLAFGFTAQQVPPMLTAVGDAVAGLGGGTAEIERVTVALGQMQAKGKVSAEEMNQLAELGIPAWKMLADQLGITIPEAMKQAEKGAISASAAIPALIEGMSQKFGGMMEKQSASLLGLWSTAKDNVGAAMRVIGDQLVATFDLKTKLAGATKWLGDFAKLLKEGGIRQALEKMIPPNLHAQIVLVAGAIGGAMTLALIKLAAANAAALVGLAPWVVAGAALAGIIYVIAKNWDNWAVRLATVLGVIGTAVIVFTNVTLALKAWAAMTKVITVLQAAWNAVMTANPIGLVILLIAGLVVAGVALYKNWDTVKRIALNVWGAIKATILTAVASVVEAYGKFVGVFNKGEGERIKASAEAMRQQAAAERQVVDERNGLVEGAAQAAADAEEQKALHTWKRTTEQKRANDEAAAHETDVWGQTTAAAGAAEETKKDYLDDFSDHFSRTQDQMLTDFNRAQDDQTTAFKRGQDERMKEFDAGQAQELKAFQEGQQAKLEHAKQAMAGDLEDFKRGQEDKLDAFKESQAGQLESVKRGQEDQKGVFESALDDEKQTFERHQQDLLSAFKQRQSEEIQAIQDRQEAERRALDAEYAARMDALDAEQKAMDRAAQEEARSKQAAAAQSKVDQAKKDVGRATALGDPELLAQAQKRLAEAEAAQAELLAKQKQDVRKNQIADEKDALKTEWDQRKQALKDQQDTEMTEAKTRQEAALVQYQRELDDEKTAMQRRQDERKLAFGRMQDDELTAYQLRQEEALKAYQREQEDALTAYQLRQEEALKAIQWYQDEELAGFKNRQEQSKLHYQRSQEDEMTAWKRAQDDRSARFKQELDDLKTSFKDKLGEQRAFVNDWNRMAARMASMQPDLPAVPDVPASSSSAPSGSSTPSRGGGKDPIMMADGGVAKRPVVMGEAGAEVFAPLAELWKQLQSFGATIGARMAGLVLPAIASISTATPRVAMAAPAGSDAPIILQATLQSIMDSEVISERVIQKTFGPVRQQKRAFGLG